MRITYLTNLYPAVSHTFVRREIEALEALGHEIRRVSIRPAGPLVDPDDERERAQTTAILDGSKPRLALAALGEALRRPGATLATLSFLLGLWRRTRLPATKLLAYIAEALLVAKLCRASGAELLRVHFGTNGAMVARLARRLGGPPYAVAVHGPDEFDAPERWELGGYVAESLFTTAISHFCASQIMRWTAPEHWSRVVIVHCAVGPAFLEALPLPAGTGARRIATIARLAPQKGLPLLLDALAQARASGADLVLDLVGDGPARATLEQQAARLGLGNAVRCHGSLSGADVRTVLAGAHALVLASFAEGLPVVLMEAMGLGRPALATRIAAIPELVIDGESGWLVPAGDVDALAAALVALAQTPAATLETMGLAAHRAVAASHAIEREIVPLASAIAERLPGI